VKYRDQGKIMRMSWGRNDGRYRQEGNNKKKNQILGILGNMGKKGLSSYPSIFLLVGSFSSGIVATCVGLSVILHQAPPQVPDHQ
jgi:hypothetical protein